MRDQNVSVVDAVPSVARTAALAIVAIFAFAANSLLCRLALGEGLIDVASFTTVRVLSGSIVLLLITMRRWRSHGRPVCDWRFSATLFIYMAFFSFAYLSLSASTGALLLFSAVQLTMFTAALLSGERLSLSSWAGLALTVFGLIFLLLPGVTAPDPMGAILMLVAGIAWGMYSLLGRNVDDPLQATTNSFVYAIPLALIVSVVFIDNFYSSRNGLILAVASGAITSGLGYVIWYEALRGLAATHAATVQLSVPVVAALGGIVFLSEQITLRLVFASVAILGGIMIVLTQRISGARQNNVSKNKN
ncbi:MAG: EamA family transporter [Proteobacteria bacterium]|jgi:drug/metabolite transporter (DMT)-like permease|nr:EamA family transporter [Pseudomonadota bacterium]